MYLSNKEISVRAYLTALFFGLAGGSLTPSIIFIFERPNGVPSLICLIFAVLFGAAGMIALKPLAMLRTMQAVQVRVGRVVAKSTSLLED